jgi:hypothetical protein
MFNARNLVLTKQFVTLALTSDHLTVFVCYTARETHVLISNVPLVTQQSSIPVAGYNSQHISMLRFKCYYKCFPQNCVRRKDTENQNDFHIE